MHDACVHPLKDRAFSLCVATEGARKAVLTLQRPVRTGPRLVEQMIAEITKTMPVCCAYELPALQPNSRRRRKADSHLDGLTANLLERPVISLTQKAEEKVHHQWLESVRLSQVVCNRRPRNCILVGS